MRGIMRMTAIALAMMGAVPAWAQCGQGQQCPMSKSRQEEQTDCGCPIAGKILEKSAFYLKNADAIGLSDEQVEAIKAIKLETKKAALRQMAEMKVFELDIQAKMSEPKLDMDGMNAMMDTTAKGWMDGAKATLATYAKLRNVLSEEQTKKAKELWKKTQ